MGTPWNGRSEIERLAKVIQELRDQVTALQAAGLHVPIVDDDPGTQYGNAWILSDNRLRVRRPDGTIIQVSLTATGTGTSGTPLPAPPAQTRTYQSTWSASWSQTYRGNGDQRSENSLHVGYGADSWSGWQTSLIGWPYATIATALTGATVSKVEIYTYCTHCWWNDGASMGVGSHNFTSAPSSLGARPGIVSTVHVKGSDQGGEPDAQRWKSVSTSFGAGLRAGTQKGTALVAPSTNATYYSVHAGVGSGLPVPKIRITYVK